MSIGAVLQRLDHRQAVVLVAQGRRQAEEGAVFADVVLVEGEAVDRNAGADVGAVGLGAGDGGGGCGGRDLGGVVAPAGEAGQRQVALQRDGLGLARNSRQAEPARIEALVHDAAGGEVAILRLLRQKHAEVARIGERPPHDERACDGVAAIGEGDGAGLAQQAELGHLLAGQAAGHGGCRMDVDGRRLAGGAQHELDQRHVVDGRLGVGHHDDGGDAARRGGLARRGDRLAVLGARLADEDAAVDEARAGSPCRRSRSPRRPTDAPG